MIMYKPVNEPEERNKEFEQWLKAVKRSKGWAHA
jgi:glycerol kinase